MLSDFFEPFVRIRKTSSRNELGGYVDDWEECEAFSGGITFAPGGEITVAGLKALRTVPVLVHDPAVSLQQNDHVRRLSDGAVFRVAGNSGDMRTPSVATVAYAQVPVERLVTAS